MKGTIMRGVNKEPKTRCIKSQYLLQAIKAKMNVVHEAKVGKEFTPEQEDGLNTLRRRSRAIGNFRFKLIQRESKLTKRYPLFE